MKPLVIAIVLAFPAVLSATPTTAIQQIEQDTQNRIEAIVNEGVNAVRSAPARQKKAVAVQYARRCRRVLNDGIVQINVAEKDGGCEIEAQEARLALPIYERAAMDRIRAEL